MSIANGEGLSMPKWRCLGSRQRWHPTSRVCPPQRNSVLSEIGIEHNGTSKSIDQFREIDFDLVVTVCDDAAENCPVWLGKGKRIHMGFPDPANAQGTDDEVLGIFRAIRDDVLIRLETKLKESYFK